MMGFYKNTLLISLLVNVLYNAPVEAKWNGHEGSGDAFSGNHARQLEANASQPLLIDQSGCLSYVQKGSDGTSSANNQGVFSQLISGAPQEQSITSNFKNNQDIDDNTCVVEYIITAKVTGMGCDKLQESTERATSQNQEQCRSTTSLPSDRSLLASPDDGGRKLADPYSTKIDICAQALVDIILPFSEYNCWHGWPESLGCLILPHCCIPGICNISPDCGFARTVYKTVASASEVYCFKDASAGDIWNRIKERAISISWTVLSGGAADILCELVEADIAAMYQNAASLHSDVISLMEEIRAADDTSLWDSWDSAHLLDIRINDKASLGLNAFWVQKHAITLGTLILFDDTIDVTQLTNPPRNNEGGRVRLLDLQEGTVNDPDENFSSAISTLLHEMVHVRQYTEMGTCEFFKNYLLEVVFNGYDGASYEEEAYKYELEIVPYKVCGVYCTAITGDIMGCQDSCSASPAVPDPVIKFVGTEEYSTSAGDWIRYNLNIVNAADFPPELFVLTSAHGSCGSNTNPSRTWVEIYDNDSNSYLYGFCGLTSAPTSVHFAKRPSETGPWNVRVDFVDRQEGTTYSSNVVEVSVITDPATVTEVYAVDAARDGLYILDSVTGELVEYVGDLPGYTTPVTMTASMDGKLYVYNNSPTPGLLRVDPKTAEVTPVSTGGPVAGTIAFRDNVLYASFQGSERNDLFTLDVNTGERRVACAGILPGVNLAGMDTDPNTGLLYAVEIPRQRAAQMYSIDPGTCTRTDLGTMSENVGVVGSITWNPNTGKFLGSSLSAKLYDLGIDGTVTNIRNVAESPQGMAFLQ